MGLFDPPYVNVRKRLPQEALVTFAYIEKLVTAELQEFDKRQQIHALGYVMSLWVCQTASRNGTFELSPFNFRYTENTARNSFALMTPNARQWVNEAIIPLLIEQGFLSELAIYD